MRMSPLAGAALALATLSTWAAPVLAQPVDPKYEYGKADDVKDVKGVEWKAAAQAGAVLTTGNANITTVSGGLNVSRKSAGNKIAAEASAAYAKSSIRVAQDANANGTLEANEIQVTEATTAEQWNVKTRYDRFFTEKNSGYLSARLEANEPAGKELVGGAQAGYSRLLLKSDRSEVTAEIGYDYQYENFVVEGDALNIHSARGFLGYAGKLSEDTQVDASTEWLLNLNSEDTPAGEVDALDDTRMNAKTGLTTKLWKDVAFRFSFTAKYDNAPAPRPPLALPYAAGFVPLADKLDTITEASLIVNFL